MRTINRVESDIRDSIQEYRDEFSGNRAAVTKLVDALLSKTDVVYTDLHEDLRTIKEALNFEPDTDLEDAISSTLQDYVEDLKDEAERASDSLNDILRMLER